MAQNVTDSTDQDAFVTETVTGAVEETGPASVMAKVMGDAMRDQKLRQDRMRHAQEFLSSPAFLDLRDQPMVVSDDAAALAAQIRNAEEDLADAKDDEARRKAAENVEHLKALQGAL